MKQGIGLQCQMVSGNMGSTACRCGLYVRSRLLQCLIRQSIHQIEIHIVKILLSDLYCAESIVAIMYPAQRLEDAWG